MNRDEAAQIIADAINSLGPLDNTLSVEAFATRLATALDATGLLAYAAAETAAPPVATSESSEPTNKQVQTWADIRAR